MRSIFFKSSFVALFICASFAASASPHNSADPEPRLQKACGAMPFFSLTKIFVKDLKINPNSDSDIRSIRKALILDLKMIEMQLKGEVPMPELQSDGVQHKQSLGLDLIKSIIGEPGSDTTLEKLLTLIIVDIYSDGVNCQMGLDLQDLQDLLNQLK